MRRPVPALASTTVVLLLLAACASAPGSSGRATTAAEAVRLVVDQHAAFAGIGPRDENVIGQAAWYEVASTAGGWQVVVRIGWGDCPAGCISEHQWTYAVGQDGRVELLREEGDDLPDATGVRGTVTAGPICPVERDPPDPACAERPVAGAVLVFTDMTGTQVAQITSAADGSFRVELPPGAYRITAEPVEGLMGTPDPMEVEVVAGQPMMELELSYDTGIR